MGTREKNTLKNDYYHGFEEGMIITKNIFIKTLEEQEVGFEAIEKAKSNLKTLKNDLDNKKLDIK